MVIPNFAAKASPLTGLTNNKKKSKIGKTVLQKSFSDSEE